MANGIIYYDFFRCLNYLASFEVRLLLVMVTSIWTRKCINVIIERYLCHSNAIYLRHMKNADASNVRVYRISRNQPEIRRQAGVTSWTLPVTMLMSGSLALASSVRACSVVLPSTTTLVMFVQL